jgi:hypothetical protein
MSEVSEYQEPYDEESVFLQDEASIEQLPRPLHLDAIFEEVRLWQAEHSNHVFTSRTEASLYMKRLTEHFDLNVQTKNMLGRYVSLYGAGLAVPNASYDDVTGRFTCEPAPVEVLDPATSMSVSVEGVKGSFAGFGYRLTRHEDDLSGDVESDERYKGVLLYQVATNGVSHAHGYTQFFATGNVLDSYIEFKEDAKKEKLDVILTSLLSVDEIETAQRIDQLNSLLANEEGLAGCMAEIAAIISDIAASADFKDSQVRKDLLIDLLTHYLDPEGVYSLATPDALCMMGGKKCSYIRSGSEPISMDNQKVSSIILDNAYRRDENDKVVISKSKYVPYFVIEDPERVLYIPMDRLLKFSIPD